MIGEGIDQVFLTDTDKAFSCVFAGEFSRVYRANYDTTNQQVAVKILKSKPKH